MTDRRPLDPDQMDPDEQDPGELIAEAGRRPEIPAQHLEAIRAAVRSAWEERQGPGDGERGRPEPSAPLPWQPHPPAEERAEPETADPDPANRPGRRWAWALAASLVLMAVSGWWATRSIFEGPSGADGTAARPATLARVQAVHGELWWLPGSPGSAAERRLDAGDEIPVGAHLEARGGGGSALRFEDGLDLRLAAGTRLALTARDALDLEAGAVYVDTGGEAPAGGAPAARLAVHTALGTARDVGTRFSVRLRPMADGDDTEDGDDGGGDGGEGMALEVRVRDGRVDLTPRLDGVEGVDRADGVEGVTAVGEPAGSYRVGPGEELILEASGRLRRQPLPPGSEPWSWAMAATPGFPIDGRSLGDLLAWVQAETGWTVRFEDPALARQVGEIELYGELGPLPADRAVFAVLPGAGLEGELAGGTLTLRRSAP